MCSSDLAPLSIVHQTGPRDVEFVRDAYARAGVDAVVEPYFFDMARQLAEADLIVACGAAGATLLDERSRRLARKLRVLIDLNAVPPAGIEGIAATDKAREWDGAIVYGALGVGGTKMKIHRAAVARLFASNDACLDAEDLLAIGESL